MSNTVELKRGLAYQFDYNIHKDGPVIEGLIGIYEGGSSNSHFWVCGDVRDARFCTNIVKLAPEVK